MSDLISRQAAIAAVKSYWKNEVDRIPKKSTDFDVITQICDSILTHNANICKAIDKLPSAQPERKKGKWINHRKDDGHNIADCDQCGNAIQWFDGDEIPRYCCMCGADMRGKENG